MRTWKEIVKSLTDMPRGFNADGHTLGLGLATAMQKQREDQAAEVEQFLRDQSGDERERATQR
ncbi:hypothetical protein [Amycolatopsis nigrescens]|uniref:hypothetical protein n=1 Tax=Amycolatopsis nigrescens TaxID=381445 RepID=UPI00037F794A|nr:hypothetical protein [Amycolatopsis nigrescens]